MKAKAYLDLKKKHEKELSEFPIAYAFNDEQLQRALEKLGVESTKECVSVFGHGDIVKKENAKPFIAMLRRHNQEVLDLLISDKDVAYETFVYEMDNHEYAINYDGDGDVLGSLGLEEEDLDKYDLHTPYILAKREHMRKAHEEWDMI